MNEVAGTRRPNLPLAAVCLVVFVWSFGPLFVRATSVSSLTFAFFRLWIAVPVMWVAAYASGGRPSMALLRRALPGGVLFGISMVLGFLAYRATSIANATLIPSLTPAVILVLAQRLFGEQRSRRQIVLASVAFLGVFAVVLGGGSGSSSSLLGDLYAGGNLAVWTVYLIKSKRIRNDGVHAWALIATFFTIAAVVVSPVSIALSDDLGSSKPMDFVWYAATALLPGLVGHGLMTWAQRDVDISVSSVLTLGNAPLSMVGAWVIYGESLTLVQVLGVATVLAALSLIAISQAPGSRPRGERVVARSTAVRRAVAECPGSLTPTTGWSARSENLRLSGSKADLLSCWRNADVAQLVEHHLAKVRVASSNLVVRSMKALLEQGLLRFSGHGASAGARMAL